MIIAVDTATILLVISIGVLISGLLIAIKKNKSYKKKGKDNGNISTDI